MKSVKNGALAVLVLVLGVSLGAAAVEAQGVGQDLRQQREERREARLEARDQRQDERREKICELVKERVGNRVERYRTSKERHSHGYVKIKERVLSLKKKMEERGCDTSGVAEEVKTLEGMVDQLPALGEAFIDALEGIPTAVCADYDSHQARVDAGRKARRAAHDALKAFKGKIMEIRQFVNHKLKPDLLAAGKACNAQGQPQEENKE